MENKKPSLSFEDFQKKHKLTESELEYYIERTGIMTQNGSTMREAHNYAMRKIKEMRL